MNPLSRGAMDLYYRFVEAGTLRLGTDRSRILGAAAFLGNLRSWVGYVGPRKSRRVFLEHMATALPHLSSTERTRLLHRFWFFHQLRFLDLFVVARSSKSQLGSILSLSSTESIDRVLSGGRGSMIVTLHVGDPRFCHVVLGWKGYPLTLLSARYDDYSPKAREARLRASTKYHAVRFLDRSLRWVFAEVDRGSLVFMAISGYAGPKGHSVSFLNRDIWFSSAPARISYRAHIPVIPAVDLFDEAGNHALSVLEPLAPPAHETEMLPWTKELVSRFERITIENPAQLDWIWYVIRCQEAAGDVTPYEEGKAVRMSRSNTR